MPSTSFPQSSGSNTPTPSNADGGSPRSSFVIPQNDRAGQTLPPSSPPAMHPHFVLPKQKNGDLVPINSAGHRLDVLLPPPSGEDRSAYSVRIAQQGRLCNEYQLKGYCTKGGANCILDHSPIPDNVKLVLKHMVHSYPCSRRGACRRQNCDMGHICFLDRCNPLKRNNACRLNSYMHVVDPVVSEWVAA